MSPLGRKDRQHKEMQSVVNSAKTLLAIIRFMSVDNPIRTVAITSAVPNKGKTFVTANLAIAMGTSGERTLVVECDMRRRSMSAQLGIHATYGLYSVMAGKVGLSEAVVAAGTPNLFFLDAEPHIPNPSDLINSQRFSTLIAQALEEFDYVVFDSPPVGTFVDAAVLGTKVDAVFMVVREKFARRAEVVAAAEQLAHAGVNLAGVVMNCCERSSSEYYYEYYYSHDERTEANEPILSAEEVQAEHPAPATRGVPSSAAAARAQLVASAGRPAPEPQRAQIVTPVPTRTAQPSPEPATQRLSPSDTGEYVALAQQIAAHADHHIESEA